MLFKRMLLVIVLVVLSIPLSSYAQDDKAEIPLSVWTAGQIDPADNSVFYSVLMTSGQEALTDVTISAVLPEGATFVKDFWKPEAATFAGEKDGVVSWTMSAVEANVVAGPFTFVVSYEGSDSEDFAPPASFKATVNSSVGTVENEVTEETLARLADSGSLEITPDGMMDIASVEETGLWLYVPAGAVSSAVTLHFQRNKIDAEAKLPEVAEETWWCGFVSISASADVSFAQPIILVVPLLRVAAPGTILPVFAQAEGGDWTLISAEASVKSELAEDALEAPAFAKVAPSGTEAYIVFNKAAFGSAAMNIAVGINTNVRSVSVNTISVTSFTPPPPPAAAWQNGEWF